MRYGMIGNCKTAALIHESGDLTWCCFPRFDVLKFRLFIVLMEHPRWKSPPENSFILATLWIAEGFFF